MRWGGYTYDYRIIGFDRVDPLTEKYFNFSPFHFTGNNAINNIEIDGKYYIGIDGLKVKISIKNGSLRVGKNASSDLIYLVNKVNNSGSKEAINEVLKGGKNKTKIHVKVEADVSIDDPNKLGYGLLGLHQAHDKNGNALVWNASKEDWEGTPDYIAGEKGVYSEATITIFKGNIESVGPNYEGITTDQEIARVFQHEVHHDTDKEFISDLKNRREGKRTKFLDSHDNITPKDRNVVEQMIQFIGSAGQAGSHLKDIKE